LWYDETIILERAMMKGKVDIMKVSQLGIKINELRKERNITQEELGRAVGVSGQAVSKWECGGAPDAELIPAIADYFHVTIGALFGRAETEQEKPDIGKLLTQEIMALPKEKRMEVAYDYCWIMQQAICIAPIQNKNYQSRIDTQKNPEFKETCHSRLMCEDGFSFMRIMKEQHYFLLMPEPEKGFKSCLMDESEYIKFFSCLARENCLKILIYLYSMHYEKITADYLADMLSLSVEEVNTALAVLIQNELMVQTEVKTGTNKNMYIYYVPEDFQIVPFLIFANEFIKIPKCFMFQWGDRTKSTLS
jgi:transcriptional regulator with XRE-family HTH domain